MFWNTQHLLSVLRAIQSARVCRKQGKLIDRSRVTDIEEISENGVTAKVDGKNVAAGNAKLMERLMALIISTATASAPSSMLL